MTIPQFTEPFHPFYDIFSISRFDFSIPSHFDVYQPDFINSIDFQCLSVICPNPAKGAIKWTKNGRWITIGIYKDEGRSPAKRPPTIGLTWSRVNKVLTIVDPAGHRLRTGDLVNLYNVNIGQVLRQPITVINETTFTAPTVIIGPMSGNNGAYQPSNEYKFSEENYVFRLLPSFKLIPIEEIQQLFLDSAPSQYPQTRELYNITKNQRIKTPQNKSNDVNYDLPIGNSVISEKSILETRFDQQYDENNKPLKISYYEDGQPVQLTNYDEKRLNLKIGFNQVPSNLTGQDRVVVYDFYGLEINDINRGPFYSASLITRDQDKPGPIDNIARAEQNGEPYYSGKLYDVFGNLVIGIQDNNATVSRNNLLPLKIDRFNRPVKLPNKTTGQLIGY